MTTAETIKLAFDLYFNLQIEAWNSFVDLGEIVSFEKEQIIKENGRTEKYLYFLLSGSGGILLWNKTTLFVLTFAIKMTSLATICRFFCNNLHPWKL